MVRKNLSYILTVILVALSGNLFASRSDAKRDREMELKQLTAQGYVYLKKDNPEEALKLYKTAASSIGGNPSRQELIYYAKSLNNIGYIYLFLHNDPERAYPYLLRAKRIASENQFNDLIGGILDNIAKIQKDFGDPESAIDTYQEALKYSVADSTDVSGIIQLMIFNDMVSCAIEHNFTGKISASINLFDSLPLYDIPMGKYSKTVCTAMKEMTEGAFSESTSTLIAASSMIDSSLDRPRYQSVHNLMLATLYHLRAMPDSSLYYLKNASELATTNHLNDLLPRIYRGFGTVIKSIGRAGEANEWFLKAYEMDDSMHNSKTYARINTIEPALDIDLLQKEMRIAAVKHNNRLSILWILLGASILILILLLLLLIRNRKLRNSYSELASRHQESIRQAETSSKVYHESMDTIKILRNEIENLKMDLSTEPKPQELSEKTPDEGNGNKVTLPITNEERLRIIEAVNDVMEQSPEMMNPDFSLECLSELVSTKPRYLSAILNESIGKSFNQLLAECRVKKACEMLLSSDFKKSMTVESVSLAVGYKSRTQFTTIFKRITGLTPTQYISVSK